MGGHLDGLRRLVFGLQLGDLRVVVKKRLVARPVDRFGLRGVFLVHRLGFPEGKKQALVGPYPKVLWRLVYQQAVATIRGRQNDRASDESVAVTTRRKNDVNKGQQQKTTRMT